MKRLSRRIRKRLSITSKDHERRGSGDHIPVHNVAVEEQQTDIAPRENLSTESSSATASPVLNGNVYGNGLPQTYGSEPVQPDHDYSTLDGDEEVFGQEETIHTPLQTFLSNNAMNGHHEQADPVTPPPLLPRQERTPPHVTKVSRVRPTSNNNSNSHHSLVNEFQILARQGWYWGPLTREQAERKLRNMPEASFLVRDSSDDRYLLSLSFRSNHRTLHTRIEHSGMRFSFYEDSPSQAYTSVVELIEKSVLDSNEQGVFCYSRSRQPNAVTYPVRLMHPVSRFTEVRPLQDLCRFVIRQYTRIDHIQNLPLPKQIKGYLNQSYF